MRHALVLFAACATPPSYLGSDVPRSCTTRDAEGCLGWMMERDLAAAELALYDDPALRTYVQGVATRLARVSNGGATPRVMIGDHDETYATAGRRIVIARTTIAKLESEAELAGIVAHELAHIEARHVMVSLFGRPESDSTVHRRDAEAIADERAVVLLERAGYAPTAMATALAAVLGDDDDEHPPRAERIARVTRLAAGRAGFEGRRELLAHVDGMVLGRDPRLGERVGMAWVVPALGLAIELAADDRVRAAGAVLALERDGARVLAYAVGTPWSRELISRLDDRELATSALGRFAHGRLAAARARDDSPLGNLARAIRNTLPQPPPGTAVTIVERPHGALVLELRGAPVLRVRAATVFELEAARPNRIVVERASHAMLASAVCPGRWLERADRRVDAGTPIKCAAAAVETRRDE